jgi:hypothetical protein
MSNEEWRSQVDGYAASQETEDAGYRDFGARSAADPRKAGKGVRVR